MFKKLLGAVGGGEGRPPAAAPPSAPAPGPPDGFRAIYDLLFCDVPALFEARPDVPPADWQRWLFGPMQHPARIAALAADASAESRVRALAYNWLRAHGGETPRGLVLGVIIEVPLNPGLDVLAAYADGGVR